MKIPSLREYMIVHQRRKRVELYQRIDDANWRMLQFSAGEPIVLESLPKGKLTIPVEEIYRNVRHKGGALDVREEEEEYVLSGEESAVLDW